MGEKYGKRQTEEAEKANVEVPKAHAEENDSCICSNRLYDDWSDFPINEDCT